MNYYVNKGSKLGEETKLYFPRTGLATVADAYGLASPGEVEGTFFGVKYTGDVGAGPISSSNSAVRPVVSVPAGLVTTDSNNNLVINTN